MTVVLTWLFGVVFAGWFVLTVLANVPGLRGRVRRGDWMGLLPNWELFAHPRFYDVVLLSRSVLADGAVTQWREAPVVLQRPWYSFIWHPTLGPKRALLACADRICAAAASQALPPRPRPGQGTRGAPHVMMLPQYLVVLNYVSARVHPAATGVQFMFVSLERQGVTGRYDVDAGGAVLFVSEIHRVDRARAAAPLAGDEITDAVLAV